MRVFFIDPQGYGNLGNYDTSLLQQIVQPGVEVRFICNRKILDEEYINVLNDLNNFSLEPFFNYKASSSFLLKILSYSISYVRVAHSIINDRPDLVHIQWMKLPLVDISFVSFLKILGIPVVYTSHNFLPHKQTFLSFFFAKVACQSVNKVIVHSKATKDLLTHHFDCNSNKVCVIPYGKLNPPLETSRCLQNSQSFKSTSNFRIKFSIIGSIRVDKGILEYLEVWSCGLKSYKDILSMVELRIVGKWDSGYFSKVSKFIRDNSITGVFVDDRWLSNQDFEKEILDSDVCVLPYLSMSQSASLMTLISYKKPCIVSDVGGLPDPFHVAKIGWIFSWQEDLRLIVEKAILKPILEIRSGWHPSLEEWEAIDKHFSWSKAGQATVSLYKELLTK
jgi:glycosyltransferase involved in cell wall biosynthesis